MKVLKIISTAMVLLFGILGLMGILEYDISQPIVFTALGLVYLITAKEYSNKGDKKSSKFFLIFSVVIFATLLVVLVGKYCL